MVDDAYSSAGVGGARGGVRLRIGREGGYSDGEWLDEDSPEVRVVRVLILCRSRSLREGLIGSRGSGARRGLPVTSEYIDGAFHELREVGTDCWRSRLRSVRSRSVLRFDDDDDDPRSEPAREYSYESKSFST